MQEKNRKTLLICLEVVSLAILVPVLYCGTVKLLLGPRENIGPIEEIFYPHMPYQHRIVSTWMFFGFILVINVIWIILMKKCLRNKIHVKVVLTLLVLTISAAVISCFVILDALSWE